MYVCMYTYIYTYIYYDKYLHYMHIYIIFQCCFGVCATRRDSRIWRQLKASFRHMLVSMCVCVGVTKYTYVWKFVYEHTCIYKHVYIHDYVYIHSIYMCIYIDTVHIYMHVYVFSYICIHMYMYALYTYIYIY